MQNIVSLPNLSFPQKGNYISDWYLLYFDIQTEYSRLGETRSMVLDTMPGCFYCETPDVVINDRT